MTDQLQVGSALPGDGWRRCPPVSAKDVIAALREGQSSATAIGPPASSAAACPASHSSASLCG